MTRGSITNMLPNSQIGGSAGHLSKALAKQFPKLKFIVQDMKETVEENEKTLPEEFKGRISYQVHDCFTPQPVEADVYMMRHMAHSWPDKWCIKLIKETAAAMRPGSKMLIIDVVVLPPQDYTYLEEKWVRYVDCTFLPFLMRGLSD